MAEEPDRIRDDIELTRARLAHDVDRLADKTSPTRVAQRGWETTKAKARSVTERVMGSAHDGGSTVSDKTSELKDRAAGTAADLKDKAADTAGTVKDKAVDLKDRTAGAIQQAPAAARRQTQGNPLAAGLIAFGAGLLAAQLLPATEMEKRAGRSVREHGGDLVEQVREPLTEAAQELGDSAKQAVASVKETAKDAAQTTAQATKDSTRDAAADVKQRVSS